MVGTVFATLDCRMDFSSTNSSFHASSDALSSFSSSTPTYIVFNSSDALLVFPVLLARKRDEHKTHHNVKPKTTYTDSCPSRKRSKKRDREALAQLKGGVKRMRGAPRGMLVSVSSESAKLSLRKWNFAMKKRPDLPTTLGIKSWTLCMFHTLCLVVSELNTRASSPSELYYMDPKVLIITFFE